MGYVALWFPVVWHLAVGLLFSHPMPLGIREFAHCWGRDFRDHGGSWDISMVLDRWRLGFVSRMYDISLEFIGFRECPVVVS